MSAVEPGSAMSGLVERVKALILRPAAAWAEIEPEPATIGGLYRNWILPLAAIPVVAGLIGASVFGYGGFGVHFRPALPALLVGSLVGYALTLGAVYFMALIIDVLAPTFAGEKNRIQAFKVAAYFPTAAWVAGVFQLVPALGILALVGGLYSLFLLYKGLPQLMKAPEDRALPYTAAVVVLAIVVMLIISVITAPIMRLGSGPGLFSRADQAGSVTVGGKSVDLGRLEAASKRMEEAARRAERGEAPEATDPQLLKGYLPEDVGGFTRTELTTQAADAAGLSGSSAEGIYAKGDARMTISVTDLGGVGALAAMADAFNVQSSSEREGSYEKMGRVDGRMTQESYDRAAKHGEYSVLVADRFMISAEGDGVTMDELKAAVAAIGPARLEGLAKG